MTANIAGMAASSMFFEVVAFLMSSLVIGSSFCQYHYWFGVVRISTFKKLTGDLEVGNTPV